MSDLIYDFLSLNDVVFVIAVLVVIKIGLDIRDRRKAYRENNHRFDRLHNHLDAIDKRMERQLRSQQTRLKLMGDRIERIENSVLAPYRMDDD